MSPAVISITIVAYFIILFTISYIAGRKADNEGFFVGNRKSAWYVVAFAMIGSTIRELLLYLFRAWYKPVVSLICNGTRLYSRTVYYRLCACSTVLSDESGFYL